MRVEYELDQWEWQGTTHSIEIDPQDYQGMAADEIKALVYDEIFEDAINNLHLVYKEEDVAQEILESASNEDNDASEL